jgi:PIN domain nuclease of toxin-antitoxin system
MSNLILDASAILVLLNRESGSEKVEAMLPGAFVSSVNVAEVAGKLADLGMPASDIQTAIDALGLTIVDFDAQMALEAGILRAITCKAGLSLGDRACLAAARILKKSVVAADRTWADIKTGVKIRLVR